jgi:hypothetical protein
MKDSKALFFTPTSKQLLGASAEIGGRFRPLEVAAPLELASDVPDDCNVYVFYLPGMKTYDDLVEELKKYGKDAGKNIFVGIWSLGATSYSSLLTAFKIKDSPAVVVTGNPKLSTDGKTPAETVFATISNKNLLNDTEKAGDVINRTCNLFMEGKVKEALSSARKDGFKATLDYYLKKLYSGIVQFLKDVPITWNYANGTITFGSTSGSGKSSSTESKK